MVDQEKIHNQCLSKNLEERNKALRQLEANFSSLPDKKQAWSDLIKLINDKDSLVRYRATYTISSLFSYVPNKQQAWSELHKLTNDRDYLIRCMATSALGSVFSHLPDEQQAWNDLVKLTNDKHEYVREVSSLAISSAFSYVLNKQKAWNDLHELTNNKDRLVRFGVTIALGSAFFHIPDKQQAWNDLIKLTNDEDSLVRGKATYALGSAFFYELDKQQAWNDLHKLTSNEYRSVRAGVASAIGSAYPHIPDKQQAWSDLDRLTDDKEGYVRAYANHSLGKISIFKASEARKQENYKKELENAIEYFEKATQESIKGNPAEFCFPFYRSFHTIIFEEKEAKGQVDKYLAEARDAVKGSKSKELLFEAVGNLANALEEVQKLESMDLQVMKDELNFYRKYCDRTAELMIDIEEVAPYAVGAMRKGLPILDRNLKKILEEIQEKAKIACQVSQGTPAQEIACTVNIEVQKWEISSQEEMSWYVPNLVIVLKSKIPHTPENKEILDLIESMKYERDIAKQYSILPTIIALIPTVNVIPEQELDQKLHKFDQVYGEIVTIKDKLSCISFDIFKIKLNSADVVSNLKIMKEELEKLNKIDGLNKLSTEKLDSIQAEKLNSLNREILERLEEMKILIDRIPKNDDTEQFYKRLDKLKQSKSDMLMQKSADVISIIGFAMQLYQQYKLF